MSTLIVHNIPAELFEQLTRRAEGSKRSLEDEALLAIQRGVEVADPTPAGSPDWSSMSDAEFQTSIDAAYQDGGVDKDDQKILDAHFALICERKDNIW